MFLARRFNSAALALFTLVGLLALLLPTVAGYSLRGSCQSDVELSSVS